MNKYYFKFVVFTHRFNHFDSILEAFHFADKEESKVYMQIFHRNNPYKEPYDEVLINKIEDIKPAREKLIKIFNKHNSNA